MKNNILLGNPGKFYEDFKKGEVIIHRLGRTVTYQDNIFFTNFLLNTAPLHFDKEYMEQTEFHKPLLVMTMTYAIVCGIVSDVFKNVIEVKEVRNLRMISPVFDGDTIHVKTEIIETKEIPERKDIGLVTAKHIGFKDYFKTQVIEFERDLYVLKKSYFFELIKKLQ